MLDIPTFTLVPVVASVFGIVAVLAGGMVAHYGRRTAGRWHSTYVVTAVIALYLDVFVLVVHLFAKTPALAQLAPTQRVAPFAVAQVLVLLTFVWIGWSALRETRATRVLA